ncbi:Beta-xylosidase [Cohnella sp. OV330]|uniref:family 43 glycosylhydrolase n=1 Tax=Cohnella sp. OV330 TaxID=1855288 RepID=UPI0008ECD038|nr:family 43 glycosylhydrolase [Cohnella sp. OV330]SFB53695.1 Beta-xylosidase [Cohnella sp. OV330]
MKRAIRTAGRWLLALTLAASGTGCAKGRDPAPEVPARTYANPISLPDEWGEYGLGDPFVFKYDGYYYLYVSTRDTDAGIKVWRSANLVDWHYEGLCTEDPLTTAAYAPEVRYWNGKFYMYTSPAGQGHYALVADSPTGPFKIATGNFGRTIDGTTFVDDDGRWYFYYAGTGGIQAAPMTDPLTVAPEEDQTGAYMGGWTEGPTVFKRGGKYYMTYTGNHVFSAGYRVNAAVSDDPLQGFEGFAGNPVLLRTDGATVGLGHNSLVRGPDLDSVYMIYHNLEGHGVVGPLRHMDIDRVVWNGDRFAVWGPTSEAQPAPEPPAFEDRFERGELGKAWTRKGDGRWTLKAGEGLRVDTDGGDASALLIAKKAAASDFTAEYHVKLGVAGRAGAVFAYEDGKNYGTALIDAGARTLRVQVLRKGKVAEQSEAKLPENVDPMQLHELRLEKSGLVLRLYADEMKLVSLELKTPLEAGRIGYASEGAEASFGYVAFSDKTDGNGSRTAYAPMPGRVDAVHAEEAGGKAKLADDGAGGFNLAGLARGQKLSYRVNVAKEGTYGIRLRAKTGAGGAKLRLTTESGGTAIELQPASPGGAAEAGAWTIAGADGVELKAGAQTWKLEIAEGKADLAWLEAWADVPVEPAQDGFDDRNDFGWSRYEGEWSVRQGQLRASSVQPAKSLWGNYGYADYAFEADITVPDAGGQNGMLVRATDPANGMELNQNRTDFLRGYYVYLDAAGIHLVKQDYGSTPLADAAYKLPKAGEWLHLKVEAIGNRISLYAGGAGEPVIRYEDRSDTPLLHGKAGFKSIDSASRFDQASLAPL